MKKTLLMWAVAFHAIMYSVSLLYTGHEYGEVSRYSIIGLQYFLLPAIDLIFLGISAYLVREREYLESKHYCWIGFITLGFGIWKLGSRLFLYYKGMYNGGPSDDMDIFVYPGMVFCLYSIISIIYFACARMTRKESKSQ